MDDLPPIPRKLSINSAFPRHAMRLLKISLDGAVQNFVLEYDQDKGMLVRFKRTPDGIGFVSRPDGEEVEREVLHGQVTVEYAEEKDSAGRSS